MHTATYIRSYSCRIWGFRSGDHENCRFQARDILKFGSNSSSETRGQRHVQDIAKGYSFSTSKLDKFSVPQVRLFKKRVAYLYYVREKMFLLNQKEIWGFFYISFFRCFREKRLLAYSFLSVRPST